MIFGIKREVKSASTSPSRSPLRCRLDTGNLANRVSEGRLAGERYPAHHSSHPTCRFQTSLSLMHRLVSASCRRSRMAYMFDASDFPLIFVIRTC
jgi:hypothetical protein